MDLKTAILTRRSARSFKEDIPVPDSIIQEMLQMAQAAPSGGNGQSHLFGIIREKSTKTALAEAAGGQMWIASAPVVIACCARLPVNFRELPPDDFGLTVDRLRWGDSLLDYIMKYPEWNEAAMLLANSVPLIPAEHLFLTEGSPGLSACFVGWLDIKKAGNILALPENIACLFLMPVGYPKEEPGPKELKNISEISFFESFGNDADEEKTV